MTGVVLIPGREVPLALPASSPGTPGSKGDPGANVMAIGLLTAASGLTIPSGTDIVQTSGYSTAGKGHGLYVADAAVDAAWVTAHPGAGFVSSNSRGFRLSLHQPVNAAMFGAVFDNSTDDAAAIQRAENHLFAMGGGTLHFPPGIAKHSGVTKKNKVNWRGAGSDTGSTNGTVLLYTGTGDGVVLSNPINSSTAANVSIENITFKCSTRTAGKGCFGDTGSSYLSFHNCAFVGSDRGLILDQSEAVTVEACDFEGVASQTCLLWIVNGADRNVGGLGGFSNLITVCGCQFDGQSGTVAIADDGGNTHTFRENNYNAGLNHIRAVGVVGLTIAGGEWESASGANLVLAGTTLAGGGGVGQCSPVLLSSPIMVPTTGQSCVSITSVGQLILIAPFFGNSTAAKVAGSGNANGIFSFGASNGGGGALFDGVASNHVQIDVSGTGQIVSNGTKVGIDPTAGSYGGAYLMRAAAAGFLAVFNPSGVRQGYGFWLSGSALQFDAEGTADHFEFLDPVDLIGTVLKVGGTQVVGARQTGTPADATDLATAITLLNSMKAKLITHGLIS